MKAETKEIYFKLIEMSIKDIIFAKKALTNIEATQKNQILKQLQIEHFRSEITINEQQINNLQLILK